MSNKLTPKQERFCEEYLIDLNATQAAIRAGYSEKTANRIASQNLSKLDISKYITELKKEREEKIGITAERVLAEIEKMAFVKESDFYHDDGTPKQLSELTEDQKSALKFYNTKSIKVGEDEYIDVPVFAVHDKQKSLDMLMKHLGQYEKDNTRVITLDIESTVLNGLNTDS